MQIDTSTEFGARVERRLRENLIGWLTTVRADGTPEPSPIWFFWDGESILIYSQPNNVKLRNIARSPKVSLNLDSDTRGGDVVVLTGEAKIVDDAPAAHEIPAYVEKYRERIARNNWTPESFAQLYSVAIRMTPTKLRGH